MKNTQINNYNWTRKQKWVGSETWYWKLKLPKIIEKVKFMAATNALQRAEKDGMGRRQKDGKSSP